MKKLWYSIKTIIYTYLIQYISISISILIYILLNKNILDINSIYKYIIVGITITIIPISIYLFKKYHKTESHIELKKIFPMIFLGLNISLFYNMLTINLQPEKTIINLNIFILILYTVILGPIYEELLFRYVSLNKAQEKFSKKTSIIIITLIFAFLHTDIISIIYAFLLGLILSYIYIKYNNILYPIIIHISANLISIFITKFKLILLILSTIFLLITILYLKIIDHSK